MIYALVLHLRLIPGLRGKFTFNFMAIASYASIMMTYFGVNFFLTGLHSYGSVGGNPEIPKTVWYTVSFVLVLAILAYFKYSKYYKKKST